MFVTCQLVPVDCTLNGKEVTRTDSYDGAMKAKLSSAHEARSAKGQQTRQQVWRALVRPCMCEYMLTALFVGASAMGGVVTGDIVQVAFLNGFTIYTLIMIGLDIRYTVIVEYCCLCVFCKI